MKKLFAIIMMLSITSLISFSSCKKQEIKMARCTIEHSGFDTLSFETNCDFKPRKISNSAFDTTFVISIVEGYTYQYKVSYDFYSIKNQATKVKICIFLDDDLKNEYLFSSDTITTDTTMHISGTLLYVDDD
jgi:hypothetical protein